MALNRILLLMAVFMGFSPTLFAQKPLTIVDGELPSLKAGVELHVPLQATGGTPTYVWTVASGQLPDGLNLTPEGLLIGRPTKPGTFNMTLKVEDSARPPHFARKDFKVVVSAPPLLQWLQQPAVHDNRIDGSVQVSNGSADTYDLTVVVVAVASLDSRATTIGYQHFPLKPGTTNFRIPFGNTLPNGGYVIHADAVAEVPSKKTILKERLQTPGPLQITVGP